MAVVETIIGAQTPRVLVIPEGDEHPKWSEIVGFVRDLSIELDPWQWDVLHAALLRQGDYWAAFTVGVCCPRQNGKNGILEIRELIGPTILGEKLLIHTAHLADTSKEAFRRLDDILDANEWLSREVKHIWRTNGHESIEFQGGNRIRFRTRTRGGGRGFAGSPVFFDESMFLPEVSMASIMPVVSAQPDPQLWYMGSAVDQMTMEDGVVFARVRERALKGDHERLAYFEWSLEYETPDEVPAGLDVQEAAAATNPAYGIRITATYIEAEAREFGEGSRSLAVERLGVGDWPRTDGLGDMVISPEAWSRLVDEESEPLDPVCFVFDVTPDRRYSAIAAVGRRLDGRVHGEIAQEGAGTGWVVPWLVERNETHRPMAIVCDDIGPAASLVPELEQAGISIVKVNGPMHAQACGLFYDAVEQDRFRHRDQASLRAAVRGAVQRPLGERWAWSRKNSTVNIAPLVALTLGVGYMLTNEVAQPMVAFV